MPDLLGGLRWWDQNVKIHFFLEHGHVAYQTKGNHGCSNMVEIFWQGTPPTPSNPGGQKVKIPFLQNIIISNLIDSQIQKHGSKYSA